MNETTAEAAVDVDADRDRVWAALTDPEQVRAYWLGASVDTDWEVGSPITWSGEWDGTPYQDKGEILEVDPGRTLAFSHWSPMTGSDDAPDSYHVVTFTLDDADGGTRVTLRQSNLTHDATDDDRAAREDYERNWATLLDGLKSQAEG